MSLNIRMFDERRQVAIPGNRDETIAFATKHLIEVGRDAIAKKGKFTLALSGGSTPKAIFKELQKHKNALDWSLVFLFWSDERCVPPDHPDSNYKMAMESGISLLSIPKHQIFRMHAEDHLTIHATLYEEYIKESVPSQEFDLIMLGMGEDGHTASLFPHTKALEVKDKLVVGNYIPQKETHRMTFTFPLIQKAKHKVLYVLGTEKKETVLKVLQDKKGIYPAGIIGIKEHPALWILDTDAASLLPL